MANDQTLQVVFSSADEAAAIKAVAADLNMPVSAYLRGLILARSRPVVAAWWYVGFDHEPRDKWRKQITAMLQGEITKTDPPFFLELVQELDDGAAEYLVHQQGFRPLTASAFRALEMYRSLEEGRLMLSGSPALWRIERSIANQRAREQIRWRLAADRKGTE